MSQSVPPSDDRAAKAYAAIQSQLLEWGSSSMSQEDNNTDLFETDVSMMMMMDDFKGYDPSPQSAVKKSPSPFPSRYHGIQKRLLANSPGILREEKQQDLTDNSMQIDFVGVGDDEEQLYHDHDERPTESHADGDYRTYHDALDCLIRTLYSQKNQSSVSSTTTQRTMSTALLDFFKQLSDTCHVRSSLLHSINDPTYTEIHGSYPQDMNLEHVTELEGHFWDLLYRLYKQKPDNLEFLLWNPTTFADGTGRDYFQHQRRLLDSWIAQYIEKLAPLDPATVGHTLVTQCFYQSTEPIPVHDTAIPSIPSLVHRRQVILDWVEACHSRSVVSLPHRSSSSSSSQPMWKDTVHALKEHKTRSTSLHYPSPMNEEKDEYKCSTIDPDAPLRMTLLASKQGKSISACMHPLYGNDNAHELLLLSTVLSLLKAGRFDTDALDYCRSSFGQPWRAAVWGGDVPYGTMTNPTFVNRGNPSRPLWKRGMWSNSQRLHEAVYRLEHETESKATITSTGALVYEAAICSILADNIDAALQNPKLNKNYMDSLWVCFRGMQKRVLEEVYYAHNQARRKFPLAKEFPPIGSEFEEEEREQLASTHSIIHIHERDVQVRLERMFGDLSVNIRHCNDSILWNQVIGAFLCGQESIECYLSRATSLILSFQRTEPNMSLHCAGDEAFLRFITHLLLILDIICDDSLFGFKCEKLSKTMISSTRNDLLYAYVKNLMSQRCLWHLVALYSSLLPMDILMDVSVSFWTHSVLEDRDRKMILKQAREYFAPGTDILILRRVVRKSLQSDQLITMDSCDHSDTRSLKPLVSSFVQLPPPRDGCPIMGQPSKAMDSSIRKNDIQKMQSLSWFSFYPEHYSDAIICSNMLLRRFLLESNLEEDGLNDLALYSAKVFISRFPLPLNTDADENTIPVSDFRSMCAYLEAHSTFALWKGAMAMSSPRVVPGKEFAEGTVEGDIGFKIEKKLFIEKKKERGLNMMKAAEAARQRLMGILKGGWLFSDDCFDREERRSLQAKYIPHAVSLLCKVLIETGLWMDVFNQDIEHSFGRDHRSEIASKIYGGGSAEDENPFLPETWHRMALNLAIDVASDENHVTESLAPAELQSFVSCMANTAASLLLCEQNKFT